MGPVGDLQHNRNIPARTTSGIEPNYPWSPSLRREGPGPPVRGLFPCLGHGWDRRRGRIRAVHEVTITIRWRDVDNYGHVNNAVYLTYLEECRDRLVESLFGTEEAWDFVLARVAIDYRNQLTQADGQVLVRCGVAGHGTSSVRTWERITKLDGTVAAESEAVIVPRDPAGERSRPLTDAEQAILRAATEEPS